MATESEKRKKDRPGILGGLDSRMGFGTTSGVIATRIAPVPPPALGMPSGTADMMMARKRAAEEAPQANAAANGFARAAKKSKKEIFKSPLGMFGSYSGNPNIK